MCKAETKSRRKNHLNFLKLTRNPFIDGGIAYSFAFFYFLLFVSSYFFLFPAKLRYILCFGLFSLASFAIRTHTGREREGETKEKTKNFYSLLLRNVRKHTLYDTSQWTIFFRFSFFYFYLVSVYV